MVGLELQPPQVSRQLSQTGGHGIPCTPPAAPSTHTACPALQVYPADVSASGFSPVVWRLQKAADFKRLQTIPRMFRGCDNVKQASQAEADPLTEMRSQHFRRLRG